MTFRDILERLLDLSYEFESNSDQQREHVLSWEKYNWCFVAILAHEQALRERIAELKEELRVTDFLLVSREEVLRAIPECPEHGRDCVPHALDWIGAQVGMKP